MSVSLTKVVEGHPAALNDLPNEQIVQCRRCAQTFRLGYSDSEWNWMPNWVVRAERAIRVDHETGHQVSSIGLDWKVAGK